MKNHRFGLSAVKCVVLVLGLLAASSGLVANLGSPHDNGTTKPKPTPAQPSSKTENAKVATARAYEALPLGFEPNVGQTDPSVQFLSHGPGYSLFLTSSEAVVTVQRKKPAEHKFAQARKFYRGSPRFHKSRKQKVLRLAIADGNDSAAGEATDELPGKSNYFIGSDPSKWRTSVPTYRRVSYRDVYPGVDLVYYGDRGNLEFDFVVQPGADTRAIGLHLDPQTGLRLAKDGSLVLNTEDGPFELHRPQIYQMDGDKKRRVKGGFVLSSDGRIGFRVERYDHSLPLVIDPALSYSTYVGGSGTDGALGIALDSQNNAFIVGQTASTDFPTVNGNPSSANPDGIAFVSKINATGTALLYSTYLGGTGGEGGNGIAVDLNGLAYVTGYTLSTDFPIVNGFQSSLGSTSGNAFVAVIDSTQSGTASLVYSSYLGGGGAGGDFAMGIAVDASGLVYVTGSTTSDATTTAFPTTSSALQSTLVSENGNAFLTVLDPSQSGSVQLVYSTYLGGSSQNGGNFLGDFGLAVTTDNAGDAYVAGATTSVGPTPFPTTAGAYQNSSPSEFGAAFVAEIATTQSGSASLIYSTYFGGSGNSTYDFGDEANAVAIDSTGKIYVAGSAFSSDFPATSGTFQTTNSSQGRAFIAKFDPTQSGTQSLVYSTLLGGSNGELGNGIAVDASGNAYVAGSTASTDFPTTTGAFQTTRNSGFSDAFLSELNPSASALIYSTYLGGSCSAPDNGDLGFGIALDAAGNPYVTGSTCSTDFPTYPTNAYQLSLNGAQNAFITKFAFQANPSITATVSPSPDAAGWNNSATTVSFNCLPGGAPIQSCTSPVTLSAEGANQTVNGTATDTASNSASTSATVNTDLTPPSLAISSPTNGATVSTPYVSVSGTITDSLSGVGSVFCNSVPASISGSSFSCTVLLSLPSNSITVTGTDLAGNSASATITVSVGMAAPTSLQVTPNPVTISVGNTQSFTAIDQSGTRRPDSMWSVSDSTIASLATNGSGSLTGVAAGQVTLTATIQGVSGQATVTVVAAGGSPTIGTVLWSASPVTGFTAQKVVQAVPTPDGPDLYSVETDSSGDILVRAFRADGTQLWQTQATTQTGLGVAVGDNFGGILLTGVGGQNLVDLDAKTGSQNWQYVPQGGLLSDVAVAPTGSIHTVEACLQVQNTDCMDTIDGTTGVLAGQVPLPTWSSTETNIDCINGLNSQGGGPGNFGPPVVGSDGSVYLEVESYQASSVWVCENGNPSVVSSYNESLQLMRLGGGGGAQTLNSYSGFGPNGLPPANEPGNVIPDGRGGVLATWVEIPQRLDNYTPVMIADLSPQGSAQADFSSLGGSIADSGMVLGDNGTAFMTNGTVVTAFAVATLQPTWTYASTGGNLSLVAATTGGTVTINDDQLGVIQLDSTGTPDSPTSSIEGAMPLDRLDFLSNDSPAPLETWLGILNGEVAAPMGPYVNSAPSEYGEPQGNSKDQRKAAARAIPVNFQQTKVVQLPNGTLVFSYTWDSSSGNQDDLAACTVGESVYYPNYPEGEYVWPLPMVSRTINPEVNKGSGKSRLSEDNNKPPHAYQQPYFENGFSATQRLWWTCPYHDNGGLQYFVRPDPIIKRKVFQDTDNYWKYQITKSGSTNTVRLPNQ